MGIHIEHVSHRYGRELALKNVSLSVAQGELVALLGPSGCGKTTLLRLIAGLEQLQHGRISLNTHLVADAEENRHIAPEQRSIGMMFQDYALFPHLTLQQNIEYGLNAKHDITERRQWLAKTLAKVGLSDMLARYPHMLSGGQQQRVALLRALAPKPQYMLLDEPFSALDEHLRQQVREDTLDLIKSSGSSALMVTHDPLEAMFIADKVVVMDKGEIVQMGSPQQIYSEPANAFVAALFGPSNLFHGVIKAGRVSTPLGELSYPHLHEGDKVKVILRAKDIRVLQLAHDDAIEAELVSLHPMGHETHFRFKLATLPGQIIHAKMKDYWQASPGAKLWLRIEPESAFIFDNKA